MNLLWCHRANVALNESVRNLKTFGLTPNVSKLKWKNLVLAGTTFKDHFFSRWTLSPWNYSRAPLYCHPSLSTKSHKAVAKRASSFSCFSNRVFPAALSAFRFLVLSCFKLPPSLAAKKCFSASPICFFCARRLQLENHFSSPGPKDQKRLQGNVWNNGAVLDHIPSPHLTQ